MQNYFGVFRRGEFMKKVLDDLAEIKHKVDNLHLKDKSDAFNIKMKQKIVMNRAEKDVKNALNNVINEPK